VIAAPVSVFFCELLRLAKYFTRRDFMWPMLGKTAEINVGNNMGR
jgi:hypothetical protein